MIDIQKNALSLDIPDMIQSVEMHRLQEEVLTTKRAFNKMPKDYEDKEKPSRLMKKRPCKFCGEDHWDRECKDAPPCYWRPKKKKKKKKRDHSPLTNQRQTLRKSNKRIKYIIKPVLILWGGAETKFLHMLL